MSEQKTIYVARTPIRHDGQDVAVGADLALTDSQAEPLLAIDAIAPAPAAVSPKAKK